MSELPEDSDRLSRACRVQKPFVGGERFGRGMLAAGFPGEHHGPRSQRPCPGLRPAQTPTSAGVVSPDLDALSVLRFQPAQAWDGRFTRTGYNRRP